MANQALQIRMFGEFSMAYRGNTVNDQINRSKKVWTILEYLITFRDKEISQHELIELLWSDDEIDNPANALKTLLYRVRSAVEDLKYDNGKNMIIYRRGSYAWNNDLPVIIDTEEFERLSKKADLALNDSEKLEYILSALEQYKGDFLPGASSELWAIPVSTYFHSKYINMVHEAISLLKEMSRYSDIISLCRKAIDIDPYDEQLHYSLIHTLLASNSQQEALSHYDYVTKLFFNHFGVTPSENLTSLYREIIKTNKNVEHDLNIIKNGLKESKTVSGPFFCEYEVFKDIYRLEERVAARTGNVTYITLLSVSDSPGRPLSQKILNSTMEKLNDTIITSLRRGDVFTRYSVSQYLIMLQSASFEQSDKVMTRIVSNFKKAHPKLQITLEYKTLPIDSII